MSVTGSLDHYISAIQQCQDSLVEIETEMILKAYDMGREVLCLGPTTS